MALNIRSEGHDSAPLGLGGVDAETGEAFYLDQELWAEFHKAAKAETFAASWLDLQCRFIGGVQRGVVVLGQAGKGPYTPLAYWPDGESEGLSLTAAAELAMAEQRGVVRSCELLKVADGQELYAVAYPVIVDDLLCGVIAIEIVRQDATRLRTVMRQLQWGCGWLEALVRRKTFTTKDRLVTVLDLVAVPLEQERFQAAATALVTELASRLDCEWVAVGFSRGKHAHVNALSHSAAFERKTNLIRAIGAAMDEAMEQQIVLIYPAPDKVESGVTRAQAQLAEQAGAGAICSFPLTDSGGIMGGMTLARPPDRSFDEKTVEFCKHLGALVGPILEIKRRDDRWLIRKAWDSARTLMGKLLGPRHLGLKLSTLLLVCVFVYLSVAEGDYRVSADAYLEGSVQRAVTAPIDGYIKQAHFRAGDLVKDGDLLCTLEDKDLRLERIKWASRKEQRQSEYSKALADRDNAQVRILDAQIKQADIQLALLDEQLARTQLKAPFDGIVVTGDLSQSLGVPIGRGDVLFEVAPLDSYRIILKVDERDIAQVAAGQKGRLALAGLPGEVLSMKIRKVTPISSPEEGRNYFTVEASLDEISPLLRPGMEGVGKIEIDRRKQLWIWTHKLTYWLRFWLWSWWP